MPNGDNQSFKLIYGLLMLTLWLRLVRYSCAARFSGRQIILAHGSVCRENAHSLLLCRGNQCPSAECHLGGVVLGMDVCCAAVIGNFMCKRKEVHASAFLPARACFTPFLLYVMHPLQGHAHCITLQGRLHHTHHEAPKEFKRSFLPGLALPWIYSTACLKTCTTYRI